MKLVPSTFNVNPVPQVVAEEGDNALTVGTGLGGGGAGPEDDEPPHPAKAARATAINID